MPWAWEGRAGLGSAGQRSAARCCFLAGILLGIPWGHRQAAHEHCPYFFVALPPPAGRFPSCSHRGVGLVHQTNPSNPSSWEMLRYSSQPADLIPQHLHRAAFHTHCTMAALKKRQGENRNEPIPAFFKVNWKEQRPTQVTPFLERLQSLFLHIFRSTLQISSWLIARNPALSSNASSHLHSGTVKVPSFSLFLHFNFSRCTSLDN